MVCKVKTKENAWIFYQYSQGYSVKPDGQRWQNENENTHSK